MALEQTIDTKTVSKLECLDVDTIRQLSSTQRGELIIAACRAAAEIEASRIHAGMPPSQPAPWPESTCRFLADAARRVREGTPR